MPGSSRDHEAGGRVTISYAGFNRPWAAWIAYQLRRRGARATPLRWNPDPSVPLTAALRDLLSADGRVLLVLDDWYFRLGPRTVEEWTSALREVVLHHLDRFRAVTVATQPMPTPVAALRPEDLRDLDEAEATRLILEQLDISPDAPVLPPTASAPRFPLDPPAVKNVPHRVNSFTGRDGILEDLHERFAAAGPFGASIAVHGVSGVGKSAIAIEYAHRFGSHYDLVYWIDARSRTAAREGLADLADKLGRDPRREISVRIRAVQEALRVGRPHRRWLLIFDGADELETVTDLLPDGPGHVLIMTLNRVGVAHSGLADVAVRPFLRKESVTYIRRRAPRLTPQEADLLADAVDDLPLMLAQTASWLNTNNMPVPDYVERIRRGELSRLSFSIDEDYPRGFQTAWAITLNTLREQHPSAAELLKLLAQFAPDRIPVQFIQQTRPDRLPAALAALVGNPIAWHSALARIADSTAVRLDYRSERSGGADITRARMHRLYHTFLRNDLPDEERNSMRAAACEVLIGADPCQPLDISTWPTYAEVIPQLGPAGAIESDEPEARRLVLNCVEYLESRGELTAGRELAEQAHVHWGRNLASTHYDLLRLEHQYANLLRRSGRYREAEAIGRALLVPAEAIESAEPSARALVLNSLEYLKLRGELTAGRELAEQARVHWSRKLPGTHYDLLRLEHQYANLLRRSGRYREAEAIGRALLARLAGRAADDWELLFVKNGFGGTLLALAKLDEANALFDDIWRIYDDRLGSQDLTTLQARENLGITLSLLGRYAAALATHGEVLAIRERILGAEHPKTLSSALCHAWTLRLIGHYSEAIERQELNAQLYRQVLGENSPETLRAEHNLANCHRRNGDLVEGYRMMRSVVDRSQSVLGPHHPETLMVRADWATFQRQRVSLTGDLAAAGALARAVHEEYRDLVGDEHPYAAGTLSNVGLVHQALGEHAEALRIGDASWQAMAAAVGSQHPWTLGCALNVAGARHYAGDDEGAAQLSRETFMAAQNVLGQDNPLTLSCQAAYSQDLRALHRAEEADQVEHDVLGRLSSTLGPENGHTIAVWRHDRMHWDFEPQPI